MFVKLCGKKQVEAIMLHFPLIEFQGNDDVAHILHFIGTMGLIFHVTLPLFLYVASLQECLDSILSRSFIDNCIFYPYFKTSEVDDFKIS